MKKRFKVAGILISAVMVLGTAAWMYKDKLQGISFGNPFQKKVDVEKNIVKSDKDGDGKLDADEIVAGARKMAENRTKYVDAYYKGGYPPEDEGVCTDVVWRGYREAGYDLKSLIDQDIRNNVKAYPRVNGNPDPNIDFRRVPNMFQFFKTHGQRLTTELKPGDAENLSQWQPGDIVTFDKPEHIAVISDKRRRDGVPCIIHAKRSCTVEADELTWWTSKITGHFRFPAGS